MVCLRSNFATHPKKYGSPLANIFALSKDSLCPEYDLKPKKPVGHASVAGSTFPAENLPCFVGNLKSVMALSMD